MMSGIASTWVSTVCGIAATSGGKAIQWSEALAISLPLTGPAGGPTRMGPRPLVSPLGPLLLLHRLHELAEALLRAGHRALGAGELEEQRTLGTLDDDAQ